MHIMFNVYTKPFEIQIHGCVCVVAVITSKLFLYSILFLNIKMNENKKEEEKKIRWGTYQQNESSSRFTLLLSKIGCVYVKWWKRTSIVILCLRWIIVFAQNTHIYKCVRALTPTTMKRFRLFTKAFAKMQKKRW